MMIKKALTCSLLTLVATAAIAETHVTIHNETDSPLYLHDFKHSRGNFYGPNGKDRDFSIDSNTDYRLRLTCPYHFGDVGEYCDGSFSIEEGGVSVSIDWASNIVSASRSGMKAIDHDVYVTSFPGDFSGKFFPVSGQANVEVKSQYPRYVLEAQNTVTKKDVLVRYPYLKNHPDANYKVTSSNPAITVVQDIVRRVVTLDISALENIPEPIDATLTLTASYFDNTGQEQIFKKDMGLIVKPN